MNTSAPKAWFLGPKAENQDYFERMLLEAFRDYCYWRRNFHPEDQAYTRSEDRLQSEFLQYQENLHDHLFEMLSHLKKSTPFFSPRYLGHMSKDLLMPGALGYLAAMFYNQNNITQEAATITTRFEAEAVQTIARMLGYDTRQAWGHLCSGGTVANIEALWVARNVRLFPWQLALARSRANHTLKTTLDTLLAETGCEFCWANPGLMSIEHSLNLYTQLQIAAQTNLELGKLLNSVSVIKLGLLDFYLTCQNELKQMPKKLRIAYSQNAHYSLRKSMGLLGLGENAALQIPLNRHLRMDIDALKSTILALPEDELLLAVVGVYGSTEEGAVDDFDRLVALRQELSHSGQANFWLHGDACYGGYALSLLAHDDEENVMEAAASLQTFLQKIAKDAQKRSGVKGFLAWNLERCQRWLKVSEALSQCDSISLDPHKLGYLPYPAGSIVYKDHRSRELIRCDAPYINANAQKDNSSWNTPYPGKYTLEGSRPGATSAAVWLAHKTVPLNRSGHGRLVAGTIISTTHLQQILTSEIARELPGLNCCFVSAEPDLNLLCYTFSGTWKGKDLSLYQANYLVRELYQGLLAREALPQETQDFIISMTSLTTDVYDQSQLNAYWQNMAPTTDSRITSSEEGRPGIDDTHLALIRTVVMDPFFAEAMTRSERQEEPLSLAKAYARTLAHLIRDLLESQS